MIGEFEEFEKLWRGNSGEERGFDQDRVLTERGADILATRLNEARCLPNFLRLSKQ